MKGCFSRVHEVILYWSYVYIELIVWGQSIYYVEVDERVSFYWKSMDKEFTFHWYCKLFWWFFVYVPNCSGAPINLVKFSLPFLANFQEPVKEDILSELNYLLCTGVS